MVLICCTDNVLANTGVSHTPLCHISCNSWKRAENRSIVGHIVILGFIRGLASLLATGQKAGFFPSAAYPHLQYHPRSPPGRWKRVLPLHTVGRPPYPLCLAFIRDVRRISRYNGAESRKIKVLVVLGRRGSMCDSVKMDERQAGGSATPEVVCRKWCKKDTTVKLYGIGIAILTFCPCCARLQLC